MDDYAQYGVALLILERVAAIVRAKLGKTNGHAKVRPEDAHEFYEIQTDTQRDVKEIRRLQDKHEDRLDDMERTLDLIHREVTDDSVRRHHRGG